MLCFVILLLLECQISIYITVLHFFFLLKCMFVLIVIDNMAWLVPGGSLNLMVII
jgi:hypothetical protein